MHMSEKRSEQRKLPDDELEALSALLDGELAGDDARHGCARWRDDGAQRERWHTWNLIGDAMRSDDLAVAPARDERFLAALQARLAAEPVVLAPPPRRSTVTVLRQRSRWLASSAVAAGFVAVAGTVFVLRQGAPVDGPPVAVLPSPGAGGSPAVAVLPAAVGVDTTPAYVNDPKVIRDARLDRYLAAHKQFAGSSALGVPSGYLRAATTADPASSR
jgi:sigma-E factor negative regulatory protein RseA